LTGIDEGVLPYVNPRTGTLRADIPIPHAVKKLYFRHMRAGTVADDISLRQLRANWRDRMSRQVAIDMGIAPSRAAEWFSEGGAAHSRRVRGMTAENADIARVDNEVSRILMRERAEGRDPMVYLARYQNQREAAKAADRRHERVLEAQLALELYADAANASLPFDEQVLPDQRTIVAQELVLAADKHAGELRATAALKGEDPELWMLDEDFPPLPVLPPLPVTAAAPLLPRVDVRQIHEGEDTERDEKADAETPLVQLISKRIGKRERAKARGDAVAPNPGKNARKKARARLARAMASVGDLSQRLAAQANPGSIGSRFEACEMRAPDIPFVRCGTHGREALAGSVSSSSRDVTPTVVRDHMPAPRDPCPLCGCGGEVARVHASVPVAAPVFEKVVFVGQASRVVGPVLGATVRFGVKPTTLLHTLRGRTHQSRPRIPEEMDTPDESGWMVDSASVMIAFFVVGEWLTRVCAIIARPFLWVASLLAFVLRVFVFPVGLFVGKVASPVLRWFSKMPLPPKTPGAWVGNAAYTTAVRIGGNGVRRQADVDAYHTSVHKTGVNAQARNPGMDPSEAYCAGMEGHFHADTLAEYSRLRAVIQTRKVRMFRVLRRVLIIACILLAVFPPLVFVAGDDGVESAGRTFGEDLFEFISKVFVPTFACAHLYHSVASQSDATIGSIVLPLTSEGWIDPALVDFHGLAFGAYRINATNAVTTCLGFGDEAKLGKHCKITCDKSVECLTPESKGGTLVGWTTHVAFVLRKCLCNAHNSLCHRHGSIQPLATRDVREVLPDFARAVLGHTDRYWLNEMMDYLVWLAKWPFGKRQSIEQSMMNDSLKPNRVKAMVKREINHKLPSKARMIQFYANLMTQAWFGPQFYSAQKTLCQVFRRKRMGDSGIDITFASGMTAVEIGQWMEDVVGEGALMFYERDGKNWDSSMQEQHALFRQDVYRIFDPELAQFANDCDKVKGFAVFPGGLLRYSMEYTVKSGHNDTTLGNSLVNAAIAYAALKRLGLSASILVAGDDLLVALYDPCTVDVLVAAEREYGITPEARVFESFEHVTFISGMWLGDGEKIGFVPLPGRLFARLWWTVAPPSHKKSQMYMRGVARGLLPVAGTIPLVRVLLRTFDTHGDAISSDKGKQFQGSKFDFGPGVWSSFERRYGLTTEELMDCESWLRGLPREALILKHHVLDRMAEVDLADVQDRGAGIW